MKPAAALALLLLLAACVTVATEPAIRPVAARQSVRIYDDTGRPWCHGARMADGMYTAGHCLEPGRGYSVEGYASSWRWSRDPRRDLGHIIGLGCDTDVTLRRPAPGEWAESRGRAVRGVRFWGKLTAVYRRGTPQEYRVAVDLWCEPNGQGPIPGDSGTGIYAGDALVGIVIATRIPGGPCACTECGDTWATGVP